MNWHNIHTKHDTLAMCIVRTELLSDNPIVDSLSLYLSLRNSADERIQQQLEQLIKEVKW